MSGGSVAFVNLGCRVNRVELDDIAARLEAAGLVPTAPAAADAIVVNSCAVTGEAEAKTRKTVRRMATLAQAPEVIVTGCVASLFASELSGLATNVTVEADKSLVAGRVISLVGEGGGVPSACEGVTPTGRTRPAIRIQDGCDNRCSYCIVWKARGRGRSLPAVEVLNRLDETCGRGAREVVLTGINIGRYRDGGLDLAGLLDLVMARSDVGRVRIGSIEPPDVTERLVDAMARHGGRVAPFLHVCLQSGSDATLRRMCRAYDTAAYRQVVAYARNRLPKLSLGTDLIVGFPGETEGEFEESLAFCEEMAFSRMHVFRYSRRPGTPAATAPRQVDPREMARRSRRMRELARRMRRSEAERMVGSEQLVLVDRAGRGVTGGLFDLHLDPSVPVGSLVRACVRSVLDDASLLGRLS